MEAIRSSEVQELNGTVNIVRTPIEDVIIRAELLPHIVEKRADARERYANYALATLRDPFEVWLTAYEDGSYRKRYIGVLKSDKDLLVVLRENRDGSLVWDLYNLMQRDAKGLNRLREGRLLYWMGQAGENGSERGGTIERASQSRKTRLRTDARGNLVRQGTEGRAKGRATFAKDSHKRARESWNTSGPYQIEIPARPYLPFTGSGACARIQPEAERSALDAISRMLADALG